jgi:hypothetical protein
MSPHEPTGPDLGGVVVDANAVGLDYVVIGGFSVSTTATCARPKDSDLLVPDGPKADAAVLRFLQRVDATRLRDGKILTPENVAGAHHLLIHSRHGIIDIMRGGLPPLDYETVAQSAEHLEVDGQQAPVAALPSFVGFKRLAGRLQDQLDLSKLEAIHGPLPTDRSPGWTHSRAANPSRARRGAHPAEPPSRVLETRSLSPPRARPVRGLRAQPRGPGR